MKLGAHCVLYGPQIATDTDAVIARLARAGAEGCELGERFFGVDARDKLTAVLDAHHMVLAGMHCNGLNLQDLLNAPEKSRAALEKVAKFVAPLPDKNIIATGSCGGDMAALNARTLGEGAADPALHEPRNAAIIAKNLNDIARDLRAQYGVQVHYHNHSWEFCDNGLLWFALADQAPDVMFALDTGWALASGYDPVMLIERYPGRFRYVHLRDCKKAADPCAQKFADVHKGFVGLGAGDMGYPRLMRCLDQALGADGWAVVEYELGNFDENSYLRALSYLHGVRDML